MAINFYSVKCPECGANLSYEEGRQEMFCSYCGTKIIMSNENEYIYRHIDEAGIKQAETDRLIRLKQLELEEAQNKQSNHIRKVLTYIWIGSILIIAALCIFVWVRGDGYEAFLTLFYVGGPVIGGGAYLVFKVLPDKENDKKALRNGGIRFPKDLEPFSDKNYELVQTTLINAGFKNIVCMNMHDIRIGLLQKPGKVESISVNGEEITSGGKVYLPNDQITITYHGK